MSGIAGLVHLDGAPVEKSQVGLLAVRMAHRGPHGVGHWCGEGVALVQALLVSTPEGGHPHPIADASGRIRVVLDGRLDNRSDLIAALGDRGPAETDASMLLRAYERWGEGCVRRLLGDFAFAVWDGRRRRLFCARDPVGLKPFVYRIDGRRLTWASEVRVLADFPGGSSTPNLGMVAEFLANQVTSVTDTAWSELLRLAPAHTLTVEDAKVRVARYWDLDPSKEIRHARHEEYAEELREILTDAVRVRMRTSGPVLSELSGGIDSSAIVGITTAERGLAPPVEAVSLVYPGRDCDESGYIDAVARHCWLVPTKVTPIPAGTYDYQAQARRMADVPAYAAMALWEGIYDAGRSLGATSLLSGVGGDEVFRGTEAYAADLLRARRLRPLVALAREGARERRCSPASIVLRYGVRPLVVNALPRRLVDVARVRAATREIPWLRPAFARSVRLAHRLVVPGREDLTSIAQGQILRTLGTGGLVNGHEFAERVAAEHGLDLRVPFLDIRVIEFAFAIPEAERWGAHRPKRVLRTAIRGLVPDVVANRLDKEGPGYIFVEELLSPATASLFRRPRIEREGWVDGDRLRQMHAEMAGAHGRPGPRWHPHMWPLWRAVAVELWLRAHDMA